VISILSQTRTAKAKKQSSNKGTGSTEISDTEQFYDYMNDQSQSNNSVEQQHS
jgi:filamentous hemagglutinin